MDNQFKLIVKHPDIMRSKMFMKAMVYFPEKISKTYDDKIEKSGIDYKAAFLEGLKQVKNDPKRILDLCTGTGFAAFLAAEQFPHEKIDVTYRWTDSGIILLQLRSFSESEEGKLS